MNYLHFEKDRDLDLILLGRVTIDLNPAISEGFKPLKDVRLFEKYLGGSPANIACGISRHGMKAGFIGTVSDDQFGDFVIDYFKETGVDTSQITRAEQGEKLGLTFTEMLSPTESSILMYRNMAADLSLCPDDIHEDYIRRAKAILISGTALAKSPSREAALKAVMLAKKNNTRVIFDIDYRSYSWTDEDTIAVYYSMVAKDSDIIMGSREEFNLSEKLVCPDRTDAQTAAAWHETGAEIVVIKHGMKGSTAFVRNADSYSVKPFPVESRKGFGGGDGYASGFLFGIYHGWDMIDCLEFGSAEASMMVRSNNCSKDLPTTAEVENFIRETKEKYGDMIARV